jgi:hypothetical protein
VYAAWEDEKPSVLSALEPFVDKIVLCQKPARPGSCHRNFQSHATSEGLAHLNQQGIPFALKTRSDLVLSERFLHTLLGRTETSDYKKILVTNLLTRIEPFHVSDIAVFSTTENLRLWFAPAAVFYEDMFSPEVQFARTFVRARKLPYPMTLDGYLRFLAKWVDLVDFHEQELLWFKDIYGSIGAHNRNNFVMLDRDMGPVMSRLVSVRFHRFLQKRTQGLTLLATVILVHDVIQRYLLMTIPKRRWRHYNVDSRGPEYLKDIPGVAEFSAPTNRQSEHREDTRPQENEDRETLRADMAEVNTAEANDTHVASSFCGAQRGVL